MIARHEIKRDAKTELVVVRERYEKNQRKLIKRITQGSSVNLDSYKDTPFELAMLSIMASEVGTVRESLRNQLELGIIHLQREFCSDPMIRIQLNGTEYDIPSSQKRVGTSLFDWWQLMNTSFILRDEELQQELLSFFDSSESVSGDPFWRRSMDLILMCLDKKALDSSILEHLKSVVKSGVIESQGLEGRSLVKSEEGKKIREVLWLPIMTLYYHAHEGNSEQFNAELEAFLELKKKWIVENKEEDNSSYWIDFPLLACCSYAHDRGVSMDVESEYIPSFVYKGDF